MRRRRKRRPPRSIGSFFRWSRPPHELPAPERRQTRRMATDPSAIAEAAAILRAGGSSRFPPRRSTGWRKRVVRQRGGVDLRREGAARLQSAHRPCSRRGQRRRSRVSRRGRAAARHRLLARSADHRGAGAPGLSGFIAGAGGLDSVALRVPRILWLWRSSRRPASRSPRPRPTARPGEPHDRRSCRRRS